MNLGGAGMSDLCKLNEHPKSEMFVMGSGGVSTLSVFQSINDNFYNNFIIV